MTDYRFSQYENFDLSNVLTDKNNLASTIDERVKNPKNRGIHYFKINSKTSCYYQQFQQLYHKKCGYCGVPDVINTAQQYEIDHFINKEQISWNNKSVHHIDNLILCCRNCNQAKKEFQVNNVQQYVHPDKNCISAVFERGAHYEIVISDLYRGNADIINFYNKMNFGYSYRKLDFLLLNLYYVKDKDSSGQIEKIYGKLKELRDTAPSLNIIK